MMEAQCLNLFVANIAMTRERREKERANRSAKRSRR